MLLANSLIGGAFGFLRKSIGSVTYSTSTTSRDGRRKQIARQKATQVKNPNTVAQIMQRMKLAPAQRFYDAFEKVVAKGIMSHSWEGVSYGNASRQEFMSRAMKNPAAIFVPKGYNAFAPGEYEVSAGTLPTFNWRNDLGDITIPEDTRFLSITDPMSERTVQKALNLGLLVGDQITLIGAVENSGLYKPFAARIIVGVDNNWDRSENTPGDGLYITTAGIVHEKLAVGDKVAAVAVIVSRGQDSSTAKRSNAQMLLLGDYKNLISSEALNAAIASYENGVAVTSLGSDWYLNNTPLTGQAVVGEVKTLEITAVANGEISRKATFLVVERVSNGQIGYSIVTDGGTGQQEAVAVLAGGQLSRIRFKEADSESAFVLGENVARGLVLEGGNSLGYVNYSPELAKQGGFTYQEF